MHLRRLLPVLLASAAISAAGCDTRGSGIIGVVTTPSGLTNLTLSAGTLSPTFAPTITSYSATVPNNVTSVTVTPVSASASATIVINGATVTSGTPSPAIGLQVGPNTINVQVTADQVNTRQYSIVVSRQG
jgi:hypothetical protein